MCSSARACRSGSRRSTRAELGIPVIGEVEYASRVSRAPLAAITGTNGKTTTTALLGTSYGIDEKKTFVVGNIGIPFISIAQETTPDDVVVAEISSFQMETADEFHPRAAAVLNISEDHLNRHGTMQVYIDCKARIFERMRGDDCVVLNADEPMTRALAERVKCRLAFFSRKERVENGACVVDGKITLMHGGVPCELIEAKEASGCPADTILKMRLRRRCLPTRWGRRKRQSARDFARSPAWNIASSLRDRRAA